jgi:hypothetical protein
MFRTRGFFFRNTVVRTVTVSSVYMQRYQQSCKERETSKYFHWIQVFSRKTISSPKFGFGFEIWIGQIKHYILRHVRTCAQTTLLARGFTETKSLMTVVCALQQFNVLMSAHQLKRVTYTAGRNYQSKLQFEHTADFFKNVNLRF